MGQLHPQDPEGPLPALRQVRRHRKRRESQPAAASRRSARRPSWLSVPVSEAPPSDQDASGRPGNTRRVLSLQTTHRNRVHRRLLCNCDRLDFLVERRVGIGGHSRKQAVNGVAILVNNMGYARALSGIVEFGAAGNDGVARTLHVSPRTLNRYLHAENASFRQLKPSALSNRAKLYLRDTNHSVEAIADMLGYQDTANFRRTFRRIAGCSPNEYRQAALEEMKSGSADAYTRPANGKSKILPSQRRRGPCREIVCPCPDPETRASRTPNTVLRILPKRRFESKDAMRRRDRSFCRPR